MYDYRGCTKQFRPPKYQCTLAVGRPSSLASRSQAPEIDDPRPLFNVRAVTRATASVHKQRVN